MPWTRTSSRLSWRCGRTLTRGRELYRASTRIHHGIYALYASLLENTLLDTCPEHSCLPLRCFLVLINPVDQLRELASCVGFRELRGELRHLIRARCRTLWDFSDRISSAA